MQNNQLNFWRGDLAHRESNIELFRIITMLLIVAHHYVTSSGLTLGDGPIFSDPLSWRSLFLLILGAWGKNGINCFVLISGYFMCTSRLTARKYAKLLIEVLFYRIVIAVIFTISGNVEFSAKEFLLSVLPVREVGLSFTDAFLCFYLCIPFCNVLVKGLNERQHLRLLLLSCFIYVFFGTVKVLPVTMNYVSWFIVLYFISSYVRLYPKAIFESKKIWGWACVGCIGISSLSVVVCTWLGARTGRNSPYAFIADSNTFLAVATGFSAFMLFRNIKIPYSKVINTVSSTTFGVLLIHANTYVRKWLWRDVFRCVDTYDNLLMPVYALVGPVLVFAICAGIDLCRQMLVEPLFFKFGDKIWPKVVNKWKTVEERICAKCGISIE